MKTGPGRVEWLKPPVPGLAKGENVMKKWISLLLALCLLPLSALAAGSTDRQAERSIPADHPARRAMEPGVSPTTGLPLAQRAAEAEEGFAGLAVTGRYYPLLVQIDATNAGAGRNAPWGLKYADILYEFPLYPWAPSASAPSFPT